MAKVPLYHVVRDGLLSQVRTMSVGEMIPPEPELETTYGVSRATVRRAVEVLVADGYLEKRQGRGTTVKYRPETQDVGRVYSWTDEMRQRGVSTASSHISIRRERAGRKVASELGIRRDDWVVVIARVRNVHDVPVAITVNYLDEHAVPGLADQGLSGDSLYDQLFQDYGIELVAGDETIGARDSTAAEASLLEIEEGAAILHIRRRTLNVEGRPIEVVDMVARGDRYQYHAELSGGLSRAFGSAPPGRDDS